VSLAPVPAEGTSLVVRDGENPDLTRVQGVYERVRKPEQHLPSDASPEHRRSFRELREGCEGGFDFVQERRALDTPARRRRPRRTIPVRLPRETRRPASSEPGPGPGQHLVGRLEAGSPTVEFGVTPSGFLKPEFL
jgi:hypothetical protein